jgi:hypothetical protein
MYVETSTNIGSYRVFPLSFTSGCYWSAKKEMGKADATLAELKAKGGATKAPYEYCSAESFLQMSKMEFSENDFQRAKQFAITSQSASQAGLTEAQKK